LAVFSLSDKMPRPHKITIVGNSVPLRVRPPCPDEPGANRVYGKILEEDNVEVVNLSLSRLLSTELEARMDEFIRTSPDTYIIHLGCVDAPSREIPLWYSDVIFGRKLACCKKSFYWFYDKIIKRFLRRTLVRIRSGRSWVSEERFRLLMIKAIKSFLKETSSNILIVGINKGNDRIERCLPGTLAKYLKYDEILRELSGQKRVSYLDVSDMTSDLHFPDGVHFNTAGHEILAKRIITQIDLRDD